MRWSWLNNRFVYTFGGIALAALLWNFYVDFNDDGLIEGQVVDANGAPVEGATVRLTERTLLVAQPRGTATTDASGHFEFTGHQLHHLFLEASKEGAGKAAPVEFRLYFKGENLMLRHPLQLSGGSVS
jgi:Carboxypeptidase regulatory-like domain